MTVFSTLRFSDPEYKYNKRLCIRSQQDAQGTTTDVRCMSNANSYRRMDEGIRLLAHDQETLANLGHMEFNSKNIKGKADTAELIRAAPSIGNICHDSTELLRLVCCDLPITTLGQLISSFNKLKDLHMFRSHGLNINKFKLEKNDVSDVIKIGHRLSSLLCESCELHQALNLAKLIKISLRKDFKLTVVIQAPHLTNGENDMEALGECVNYYLNPPSDFTITMDFPWIETNILHNRQRQQATKDRVWEVMGPFYEHKKQAIADMATNPEAQVDGANFVSFLANNNGLLTVIHMTLSTFPHMMPRAVGLPESRLRVTKRRKKNKRKSIKAKQQKETKRPKA